MLNVASLPTTAARARLDWSAEVGPNPSKPVPAGDEVYVGTQTPDRRSEIHRYSCQTGEKLSTAHTWPGVLESHLGPTAIMRGPDGQLMGVSASTGDRNWGFEATSRPQALAANGEVLAVASDRRVTGLTERGKPRMNVSFSTELSEVKSLAPGLDGGWLVHTGRYTGEGRLHSLNAQGMRNWVASVATGGPQHAPAVLPDGTVLSANFEGYVSAHDAQNGAERWRFETGETYTNRPEVGPAGQIALSTTRGKVTLLDGKGQEAWTVDTGDRVLATFVHEDGTVFVQHPGCLEALDAANGKSVQKLSLPSGQVARGDDGHLYALTERGVLQKIVLE